MLIAPDRKSLGGHTDQAKYGLDHGEYMDAASHEHIILLTAMDCMCIIAQLLLLLSVSHLSAL